MTAQDHHHRAAPVVIVGSGIAGLVTALSLAPRPVLLLTRAALGGESSSQWAQGGIAAAIGEGDCTGLHVADTLAAGHGLCDAGATASILADARRAIDALEVHGVRFDRDADGTFQFGLEAAHFRRRILHVGGDSAGAAIVNALSARLRQTPSIETREGVEVRRLIVSNGRMCGLVCVGPKGTFRLSASHVVLATGGLGGLFDASTNPSGNYGQGIMLAARAGAVLADMEFVQFHPTALDSPKRPLGLVSEALRGEGAILLNERGERFLEAATGAELGPRDVVARAIGAEIARGGHVFLDARRAPGAGFAGRYPRIAALCQDAGIDPTHELIPVRPAAHYHMGGVATDLAGRSSVVGLWAVGETASTGLHGANRLASNSLLEATVMALRAAEDIAALPASPAIPLPESLPDPLPAANLSAVRAVVSRDLSVVRSGSGIQRAVRALLSLADAGGPPMDPAMVGLAIAVFAWLRRESRGAHLRTDFPQSASDAVRRRMTLDEVFSVARTLASQPLARIA